MNLNLAAKKLKDGCLVAFPTETVYGLGADAENFSAINRLYEVKDRPKNHPVIVHIADISELDYWAQEIPEYAKDLAAAFWPGPMTLLLKRTSKASDAVTGGQDVVGVRLPSHPVALELLNQFHRLGGHGVVAPSANRFGGVSPTTAQAVEEELGEYLNEDDLILDGGECDVGIESTIIDCTGESPRVLRLGAITSEMIQSICNLDSNENESSIRVSGALAKHYSPRARVLIDEIPKPGEGFIALSKYETPNGVSRLASPTTVEDYAHQLYAALRSADALQLERVSVYLPEGEGLASAIRDRVTRAASQS